MCALLSSANLPAQAGRWSSGVKCTGPWRPGGWCPHPTPGLQNVRFLHWWGTGLPSSTAHPQRHPHSSTLAARVVGSGKATVTGRKLGRSCDDGLAASRSAGRPGSHVGICTLQNTRCPSSCPPPPNQGPRGRWEPLVFFTLRQPPPLLPWRLGDSLVVL